MVMVNGADDEDSPEQPNPVRRVPPARPPIKSSASFSLADTYSGLMPRVRLSDDYQSILDGIAKSSGIADRIKGLADGLSGSYAATLDLSKAFEASGVTKRLGDQIATMKGSQSIASRVASEFRLAYPEGFSKVTGLDRMAADLTKKYASFSGLQTLRLPASFGKTIDVRLDGLRLGFAQQLGGDADAFGRLDAAIRTIPRLADATDTLIAATQDPGPLRFNYSGVQRALVDLDEVLADEEVEQALEEPLDDVREVARIDPDDTFLLPNVLGAWERVRSLRVSTVGVFCGYTVGLVRFVFDFVSGTSLPVAGIDSFMVGAAIYGATRFIDTPKRSG